jgi:hypothetical protein
MKTSLAILILIGAPILAAAIGGIGSVTAPSFYKELARPSWAPPPSVFGPVWTVLCLMMGIAAFPGGTMMRDRVDYALPLGFLGRIFAGWWVARNLRTIFDYRQGAIREMFPPQDSAE